MQQKRLGVVTKPNHSKVDAESAVRTAIVTRANAKTGSALGMSQRGNAAHTRTRSVLTHYSKQQAKHLGTTVSPLPNVFNISHITKIIRCCKEGIFGIVSRCRECCNDEHCNNPNIPWCDTQVKECTSNAPLGEPCTNNGCQSGLKCCPGSEKKCYQCCNNIPFNAYACKNPFKEYCMAGICIKKRKSGSICFEHYECVSNQCKNGTCLQK